jgi:hypothetical protein
LPPQLQDVRLSIVALILLVIIRAVESRKENKLIPGRHRIGLRRIDNGLLSLRIYIGKLLPLCGIKTENFDCHGPSPREET